MRRPFVRPTDGCCARANVAIRCTLARALATMPIPGDPLRSLRGGEPGVVPLAENPDQVFLRFLLR